MQQPVRTLRSVRVLILLACLLAGSVVCGCKGKTPVPFKRDPGPAAADPGANSALPTTSTAYPDETRTLQLEQSELERGEGSFRAALAWDLDPTQDPGLDALVVSSDAQGKSSFETWAHAGDEGALVKRASLPLVAAATGCNLEQARLDRLGPQQVLAVIDLACAQDPAPGAEQAAPDAPPVPASVSHEIHQLVVELADPAATPRRLLHLASLPASDPGDGTALSFGVTSLDQDKDGHADVQATAELTQSDGSVTRVPLVWLNRPSGLARDRAEPELSLNGLADEAFQLSGREPIDALPVAQRVLTAHRALCQESGAARVIVDESVGIACGPSAAAGRAAVVQVLALAKQQQLLPALAARAQLDAPAYKIDPADRERVSAALATIRGQTSYAWRRGPDLRAPTSPKVRLPALGFASEDQLILRGSVALSYDLPTGATSPTSIAHGTVLTRGDGGFAIIDVLSDCDGHYLRTVPASTVVAGVVAANRGTDVSLGTDQANRPGCTQRTRRSDHAGFLVLGLTAQGAVVAQGMTLRVVPFDAAGGGGGEPRVLADSEPAPTLLTPGALAQNGLRHALATSEGVAIIDRGASPGTTLVRSPASCTGKVSDVALSPSGKRVAMVCSGRVYWAEQEVQAIPTNTVPGLSSARPTTAPSAPPPQPPR